MRIVVDCRWIFPRISGVGQYTRELVKALLDQDTDDALVLLFDNADVFGRERSFLGLDERTRAHTELVTYGPFSLRSTLRLPGLLRHIGADVFHSTNFMLPLRPLPCAAVATIHDLIPLIAPHSIPRSKKTRLFALYRWTTRRAARLADRIIAVSAHTKRDILERLHAPDGKVTVVHNGISDMFRPPDGRRPTLLRDRYGIDGELIVAAGRADPYKNVIALVQAVERLVKAGRHALHCLLIGEPDERYPEVRQYVEANALGRHVRFTGYLDEQRLVSAYQEADLVVHPSLYEGFGLPPVEAMACGTPVVASNRTSLPEVLGDAAILVDPEDVGELAAAIVRALDDGRLRDALRARGLQRAAALTWPRAAAATRDVYRSALEAHRRR